MSIEVPGKIKYNQLLKLHSKAWALLFPSIWEKSLPHTVVESMLLGTPSIASRAGSVHEILKGSIAEEFLVELMSVRTGKENYIDPGRS
ncbi:MAG: glycosyltransferase [Candidatus Bathyarchaeia archaeon]